VRCDADTALLLERLEWLTQAGETWISEHRRIRVTEVQQEHGYWSLDLSFDLQNVRGAPLTFGSPTAAGRPAAGYGGLFWRGPRSFLRGKILAADGLSGPEVMGQSSPWLAYVGRHDGSARASTIVLLDQSSNPRYPTKWFVRHDPYACASCAFMFDEPLTLAPEETLTLNYRVVVADGRLDGGPGGGVPAEVNARLPRVACALERAIGRVQQSQSCRNSASLSCS